MSIAPLAFTGVSNFSDDFQTIINRAVAIAQLPITQLQNQQTDILEEKNLAGNLSAAVADVAKSLESLGEIGVNQGLIASTSDSSKVTATTTGGASAGSYSITEITSLAEAAAAMSGGYAKGATAITSGSLTLTVNGTNYQITLDASHNTLEGLRDAINNAKDPSGKSAGLSATILTTGTGENSNYLSISANTAGETTISLVDDSTATAVVTQTNPGANTQFKLNGVSVSTNSTRVSDVIPGVILDFTGTTDPNDVGDSVKINLRSDTSGFSSALKSLASNYKTLAGLVKAQLGEGAGLLSGNSIIYQVRSAMSRLVTYYDGSGSEIHSLSDLGIEMSNTGEMSFDSDKFEALSNTQARDGFNFLGSATAGFGALVSAFSQISDPVTGTIKAQVDAWDKADDRLTERIGALTDQVTAMQAALEAKLHAADTLLASLDSDQNILTSAIDSLNYNTYGRNKE